MISHNAFELSLVKHKGKDGNSAHGKEGERESKPLPVGRQQIEVMQNADPQWDCQQDPHECGRYV
jgi:hypothetical protein